MSLFRLNILIQVNILICLIFSLGSASALAANEASQTFTLDGKLYQTGTTNPLLDSAAKINVQIIDPGGKCVLYEETQTVNTTSTDGYFNINVGSNTGSSKRTVNDPGRTMAQIFQNTSPITATNVAGQTCTGSAYTPTAGAVRYFRIIVTPSATNVADTLTPDMVIDSVPQAIVAQSVQGLERASILQTNTTAPVALSQANLEALFTTPAYANLQAILAGNFIKTDSNGANLPSYASTPSGVAAGDLWYDSTTNQIKYHDGTSVQTIGAGGTGISSLTMSSDLSVNGTAAGTISGGSGSVGLTNTGIAAGTYTKVTVDAKGRATAGTVSLVEADIPNLTVAGKVSGNSITSGTISGSAGINSTGNLITTGTVSGLNVQATNLRVYSGANYVQMTAGAISSNVNFTLPTSVGSSGQVLSTDGTGVMSWITAMSNTLASGKIWVGNGSNVATAVTMSGDGVLSNTGSLTIDTGTTANKIVRLDGAGKLPAVDGSALTNITAGNISGTLAVAKGGTGATSFAANRIIASNGTGTALQAFTCALNQVIAFDASGNAVCSNASSGTVTSVTSSNAYLTVATGTSTPVLTVNVGTAANTVAAGDDSRITGAAQKSANLSDLASAATARTNLGLGTAAVYSVGTSANNVVQLDGTGKLPAVDGSQLTNISVSASSISGVVSVANGGTNSSTALNNNRLMVSSSGKIVEAGAMTDGQIMVGATGAVPSAATIGTSNGISITAGAGSLSIGTNATSNNTASTIVSRDASGDFSASAVTNKSNILKGATSGTLTMTVPATVTPYTLTWPSAVGGAGSFLTTDASGNLSWGSPAGISDSSYTVKGAVQFNTDAATSGISVASGVATVNTGTGANQIVKLDASSKLPAVDGSALTNLNAANISGSVPINKGGTGQTTATAAFNALSPTTTKGDIAVHNGTDNVRLPAGTDGYVLQADSSQASGLKWAAASAGTVTSVSSANSDISVATGVSTPVLTLNSGTGANQIVKLDGSSKLPAVDGSALTNITAGNISGTVAVAKGGTGATSFAANGVIVSNGTGSALQALNCTVGQVITFDASGYAICGAGGGGSGFANGGNSFGADATLGTNDNKALNFEVNNTVAMTISQGGNVGIGISMPGATPPPGLTSASSGKYVEIRSTNSGYPAGVLIRRDDGLTGLDLSSNNNFGSTYVDSRWDNSNATMEFRMRTAGTPVSTMTLTGSGNVGVNVGSVGATDRFEAIAAKGNASGGITATDSTAMAAGVGGAMYFKGNYLTAGGYTTGASVAAYKLNSTNNDYSFGMQFATRNNGSSLATVMTLDNLGSIGAGTTTPGATQAPGTSNGATGKYLDIMSSNTSSPTALYLRRSDLATGLDLTSNNNFGHVYIDSRFDSASANMNFRMRTAGTAVTAMSIAGTGNVGFGTTNPSAAVDVSGAVNWNGIAAPAVANGNEGRIYFDRTANKFKVSQNGGAYVDLVSSGGITSVGGQSGASQTLAISVDNSVATPTITSASDTHTWKIPMASNAGTTAGLLNKTDYDAFNNKLGASTVFAGDVSGAYNATVVQKIQGKAVTAASADKQIMIYNGTAWVNSVVSGDATLANDGTLTVDSGTAANKLVRLDGSARLPAVDGSQLTSVSATAISGTVAVNKGGTGATSFAANAVIVSNGTGSALQALNCTVGQVITFDASGYAICGAGGSTGFVNNGNSFGADATLGTNDNKALKFEVNNTVAMTISQGGNVGIGDTAPQAILSVKPTADATNVSTGITTAASLRFANAANNTFAGIGFTSNGRAYFQSVFSGAGYDMALNPYGGNVGIGTNVPSSALDVSGALTAEGMSSAPGVSASNTGRIYYDYSANKFKVSQNGGAYTDLVGGAGSGWANGGNSYSGTASIGTNDNHALNIKTNNATAMTISQSGNVGIGITAPTGILDVKSSSTGDVLQRLWNADTSGTGTTSLKIVNSGNQAQGTRLQFADNAYFVGTLTGDRTNGLTFRTGTNQATEAGLSDRMTILPGGSVGIGTTAPGKNLELKVTGASQGMRLTDSSNTYNHGILVRGDTLDIVANSGAAGNNGDIRFNVRGETATSMIISGGWVGIGTLNPLGILDVKTPNTSDVLSRIWNSDTSGTGTTSIRITNSGNQTQGSRLQFTDNAYHTGTITGDRNYGLTFRTGSNQGNETGLADRMTILPNGRVGIGTNAPATALDVSGAIHLGGNTNYYTFNAPASGGGLSWTMPTGNGTSGQVLSTNGSGTLSWVSVGGASSWANGGNSFGGTASIGTNDNHAMNFETNATTAMTISQGGNVGIGTTTPGSKLAVHGGDITLKSNAGESGKLTIQTNSAGYITGDDGAAILQSADVFNSTSGWYGSLILQSRSNGAARPILFVTGTTPSEKMRVSSTGNVGIGTPSPATALDVSGAIRLGNNTNYYTLNAPASGGGLSWTLPTGNGSNGYVLSTNGSGTLSWVADGAGSGWVNGGNSYSGTASIGTNDNHALNFETNGATAMTISQNGQIGIGTTTPGSLLELSATSPLMRVKNTGDSAGGFIGDTYNATQIGMYNPTGGTVGAIGAGVTRSMLGMDNTGKVGSLTNNFGSALAYRNVLDDGSGNFSITGVIQGNTVEVQGTAPVFRVRNTGDSVGSFVGNTFNSLQLGMYNPTAGTLGVIAAGATRSFLSMDYNGKVGTVTTVFGNPTYRNILDDGSGNMTIGRTTASTALDVSGAVNLNGIAAPAVSAGNEGRIYFDRTANKFKVSQNGAAYVDLVASVTPDFANGGNAFGGTATLGTTDNHALLIKTNNTTAVTISQDGTVTMAGQLVGKSTSNGTSTIDFATGNLQYTASNCGAFNLWNMKDGASYTFGVKGTTSATCSFTAYSGSGSGSLTMHLPTDHGATTASKHTIYTFIVLGSDVYASWIPGY